MHQISELTVSNFRSIRFCKFEFSPYTPLVGYNNAGKSNILRAIQWAIEAPSLPQDGFNEPDTPVVIEVTISGVDEVVLDGLAKNHRERIEKFVLDSEFVIRRTQSTPGIPKNKITLEILDKTEDVEGNWIGAPTGIPQALSALFPEVIFVGAMEDSAEDVAKSASGTTIGKLMKEIIGPIRDEYESKISEALSPIEEKLSSDSDAKDDRLVAVDDEIQDQLVSFFPDVVAKTHIPMPSFEDITRRATLKIFESRYGDDRENDASSMGHGAQRSIQISLINALSNIRRKNQDASARTVLLLVDEPELYLHPQAISVARAALKKLSSAGYQVVFSTHSGELIGYRDAPNTLIVRRSQIDGTVAVQSLSENVKEKIEDAETQASLLFELSNSREFLFCDRVLLIEGDTEKYLLPHLYEFLFKRSLSEDRIGLIEVGGSGNLRSTSEILGSMGIQCRCMADLDHLLRHGVNAGLVGAQDPRRLQLLEISERMSTDGQFAIANDGWPCRGQGKTAEQGFAILADEANAKLLISDLADQAFEAGTWVWTRGAIEKHLGLTSKGPAVWKGFLDRMDNADVPGEFRREEFERALNFDV